MNNILPFLPIPDLPGILILVAVAVFLYFVCSLPGEE
jgi:hypothetical protein